MSIYKRTIIMICCTCLALLGLVYIISDVVYRKGFEELERQTVEKNVTQVTDALSASLDALDTTCYNWAAWDDTYKFAQEYNQDYVDRNLQDETFASEKMSLFSALNSSGEIIYSKAYDIVNSEEILLPDDFANTLKAEGLAPANTENTVAGIMLIADQPMLVVSRPVLTSLAEGPSTGTIIIGRFLDSEVINHLSETTHLSVNLLPIFTDDFISEVNPIVASLNESGPIFIQAQDKDTIAGYTAVNDLVGNPAIIFRVVIPRDIYHQGTKAITLLHLFLISIGLVFCIVFIILIRKLLLSRLTTLSNSVSKIGSSGDISRRVTISGNDELSGLAKNINEMLTSLENADKALRESEEKYRNLFEYAKDAIVVADAQTGILVDVNPAACRLVGLPKERIVGMHQSGLHPPELAESYQQVFREHVEKGIVVTDDILVQCADGSQVRCDLSASVFKMGDKQVIQGIFRDVSERRRMEKALKESEEKFSKAFHASPDAISISKLSDGTFLEVNESYTRITGYTHEELIGKNADDFEMWANAEQRESMLQKTREHITLHNEELQVRSKSGEVRTLLLSTEYVHIGDELCLLVVSTDITERKKMEETLENETTRRRILIEQSSDGIVILDQNGAVYEANRRFADMLGYSPEEILKLNVWDWEFLFPPEQVREMIRTVDEAGDHFKTQHRRKDGTTFDVEISTNGAMFAGQKLIFCVCRDISERTRMEKALQIEKNKLQSVIDTMTDGLSIQDKDFNIIYQNEPSRVGAGGDRVGDKCYQAYEGRDNVCEGCPLESAFKDGKPHTAERRRVEPSGEITFWDNTANPVRDAKGNIVSCLEITRNITERKKQEQALVDEATRRRILIEQSSDGIVILDQNGAVYEANRRFADMLGYSPEEILKLNVWDWEFLFPPEQVREMIRTVDEAGDHFKTQHRRKDGTTFDVEISTNGAMIAGQKLIFCVCRDVSERNRMEKALKESEEKFSLAFRSSPATIAITTFKGGKYILVNDSYIHSTGYTSKELIGRTSKDVNIWAKQKDRTKLLKMLKERGRVYNEEFDFRMKSGEVRTWLFSAEQINIAGEPCLIGVSVDITDRKKAEEALREREKRFSDIAGNAMEWIWEVNTNGKYTYSSPVVEKVLGYKPEELLEKHFYDFFLPEEREELRKAAFEAFAQKQPIKEFINRNRCKNGKTVELLTSGVPVIDEEGNLLGYRGVDTDITERRRAEQALKESEEKFSIAFRFSPEMIIITDIENNKYLEINDSYTNVTGYSREEMMSHSVDDFQKVWVKPEELKKMTDLLQTQGKVRNEEFSFRMKSGEIRLWLCSADVVTIGGKQCMLAVSTDITERKKAEAELKRALSELEQSSARLADTNKELEAFSYSVSHDLRAPLRSIDGFSQAFLEDYKEKLDETGQDYLKRLRGASQKMGELIDGILKLSRLTRSEMHREPIDLSTLAEEITNRLQETQPKRRVKFVIDKELTANGDPQLMRSLLENLLGNAWKFTSKNPKAKIEFSMNRNNGKKAYFIRDNGAGFDMTYADKLFGAFQRLHEATEFPGTGIGLATVQRIIHRHGGIIWAEGAVGKGATFHFTLE